MTMPRGGARRRCCDFEALACWAQRAMEEGAAAPEAEGWAGRP